MIMGNALAKLVLFGAPLAILIFFSMRKGKARVASTTAWAMLVTLMVMPSGTAYDPPLLPAMDKHRMAYLAIAIALQIFHKRDLLSRAPYHNYPRLIFLVMVGASFITASTNAEILTYGPVTLPSLRPYDGLSLAVGLLLDCYLPFTIGQRVFRTERDLRDLLEVMVKSLLIYAPIMLWEFRMSPQLHRIFYGFTPSDFVQAMRGNGFRPIGFMQNGLAVAIWAFSCLSAAAALGTRTGKMAILWGILFLTRSLAPVIYAGLVTLLAWAAKPKVTRAVIIFAIVMVIFYPVFRANGTFPSDDIVEFFRGLSADRAQSLEFRFDNEDLLLDRANLKPMFGWGGYGRNMIWAPWGQNMSVTDGYWIILMGVFGKLGWGAFFALQLAPLVRYMKNERKFPKSAKRMMSVFALMVAIFSIDLLPNARFDYLSLTYAGILWTLSETLTRKSARRAAMPKGAKASGRQQARGAPLAPGGVHPPAPEPLPSPAPGTVAAKVA